MKKSYGNIKQNQLEEAVELDEFKAYWSISKNEVDVCKTCEFRYMCTDCRAFTKSPADQYSKPLKCGYDPETGLWSDWMHDALSEKAIQYYDLETQQLS